MSEWIADDKGVIRLTDTESILRAYEDANLLVIGGRSSPDQYAEFIFKVKPEPKVLETPVAQQSAKPQGEFLPGSEEPKIRRKRDVKV